MKKLIALTLMVACLACFSLGCGKKDDGKKPATTTTTTSTSTEAGAGAGAADAAK